MNSFLEWWKENWSIVLLILLIFYFNTMIFNIINPNSEHNFLVYVLGIIMGLIGIVMGVYDLRKRRFN